MDSPNDIPDQSKVPKKVSPKPKSDTKSNKQSKRESNGTKKKSTSSNNGNNGKATSRECDSKQVQQSTSLLPRKTIVIVSLILFLFTFLAAFSVYSPLIGKTNTIFNNDMLNMHNIIRRRHFDTADLDLDERLISAAQNWVDHLSLINYNGTGPIPREPSRSSAYGENLFFSRRKNPDADEIIHSFIQGEKGYNYEEHNPDIQFYNFTQLIWKSTRKVGCAFNLNRNLYVSCKYHPAGNKMGQFSNNVEKPIDY